MTAGLPPGSQSESAFHRFGNPARFNPLEICSKILMEAVEVADLGHASLRLGRVDKPNRASDCCELHEPEEAGRELVVAGRHAA